MTIEYPSYYQEFRCIAGRCPDTCCAGWEVDLDDEAWYRYLVVKGQFGDKLRKNMKDDGEWKFFPLNDRGRCPFLLESNLCEIYQKLGEDALCTTCREHPRYFVDCGDYEQRDLSLGCPEVARIFFSEEGKIRYVREETGEEEAGGESAGVHGAGEEAGELTGVYGVGEEAGELAGVHGVGEEAEELAGVYDAGKAAGESAGMYAEAKEATGRHTVGEESTAQALSPEEDLPLQSVLTERDRVLRILQNGHGTLEERMRQAGVWQPVDVDALLSLVDQMEPLNADWTARVQQIHTLRRRENSMGSGKAEDAIVSSRHQARQADPTAKATVLMDDGHFAVPEPWLTRLACYLIFRYWIDAYYEQEDEAVSYAPEIRLLNRSLSLVKLLYEAGARTADGSRANEPLQNMSDAAHIFSRQVEFDEENVKIMKSAEG